MSLFNNSLWGGGPDTPNPPTGAPIKDLLYEGLRVAGVTMGPDRIPSTPQFNDALRTFNRMIGFFNTNRLNIFTMQINQWPTVIGTQTYTIGPSGDWDTDRPQEIYRANMLFNTSPVIRRKLNLLSDAQWSEIALQDVQTFPNSLYNDGAYPLSKIYFYPELSEVFEIELYTWQALTTAINLDALVAYPPGYDEAIVNNLAVRLITVFKPKLAPGEVNLVIEMARVSLAGIQSLNCISPRLKNDMETGNGGWYNYATGEIEP